MGRDDYHWREEMKMTDGKRWLYKWRKDVKMTEREDSLKGRDENEGWEEMTIIKGKIWKWWEGKYEIDGRWWEVKYENDWVELSWKNFICP